MVGRAPLAGVMMIENPTWVDERTGWEMTEALGGTETSRGARKRTDEEEGTIGGTSEAVTSRKATGDGGTIGRLLATVADEMRLGRRETGDVMICWTRIGMRTREEVVVAIEIGRRTIGAVAAVVLRVVAAVVLA